MKETFINMSMNESFLDIPNYIKSNVLEKLFEVPWNQYPPSQPLDLVELIADKLRLDSAMVLLGAGSSSLINSLVNIYAEEINRKWILLSPSFSLYEHLLKGKKVNFYEWYLDSNFQFDISTYPAIDEKAVTILASPNNPTGTVIKRSDLISLLKNFKHHMFILDEAYVEFSSESNVDLTTKFDNLIVLRTFSKAFSAAGLRMGYLVSSKKNIPFLKSSLLPRQINWFSYLAVKEILIHDRKNCFIDMYIDRVIDEREKMYNALMLEKKENSLFKLEPSEGNFLFIVFKKTAIKKAFFLLLKESTLLVDDVQKYCSAPGVRVSVSDPYNNRLFVKKFCEILLSDSSQISSI